MLPDTGPCVLGWRIRATHNPQLKYYSMQSDRAAGIGPRFAEPLANFKKLVVTVRAMFVFVTRDRVLPFVANAKNIANINRRL